MCRARPWLLACVCVVGGVAAAQDDLPASAGQLDRGLSLEFEYEDPGVPSQLRLPVFLSPDVPGEAPARPRLNPKLRLRESFDDEMGRSVVEIR